MESKQPRLIDIHTHVNFEGFGADWREVTQKTLDQDVWLINVGADMATSRRSVEILNDFPVGVFATVGLHPTEVGEVSPADWAELEQLARHDRVVAIGECGLEYAPDTDEEEKKRQEKIFRKQIELAIKVDKPLMIHCRVSPKLNAGINFGAYDDTYKILQEYKEQVGDRLRGDMHFFAGSLEIAKKFVELGFTLSFTGVITFADQYDEVVKWLPGEMIMAETDAPYVTPVPYRGQRNEPLYVAEVVKKMAELRGVSYSEMAKITVDNALRMFSIGQ